jgi:hypothetical protein
VGTRHGGRARVARVVATLAIVAAALGTASPAVAGTAEPKLPKGPDVERDEACSLVGKQQIRNVFGAPVVLRNKTNSESPIPNDCAWVVKSSGDTLGRLVGVIVYPGLAGPGVDAIEVVEDDRANAQLAGPGIAELPLGRAGFVYKPRSVVEVAPSRRFAFLLQWLPTGGPQEGSPITAEVRSRLTTLAADVVKRSKSAS